MLGLDGRVGAIRTYRESTDSLKRFMVISIVK